MLNIQKLFFQIPIILAATVALTSAQTPRSFVPMWVKDASFYEIYIEQFANGDTTNDPAGKVLWDAAIKPENFYGGDLQGVWNNLTYLERLGINAIILSPIFQSSSHRKDVVSDYKSIDRNYGSIELLKKFIKECHRRKIKILLNASFDHTATDFFAFKDLHKLGNASKYASWYHVDSLKVADSGQPNYTLCNGRRDAIALNMQSTAVRQYLLDVSKFWTKMGIDGWRMSETEKIPHSFWISWRLAVKKIQPEAFLLGDVKGDASSYLQGDEFDAMPNSDLRDAIVGLIPERSMTAHHADSLLQMHWNRSSDEVNLTTLNYLGDDETKRILSVCHDSTELLKVGVLFQMLYPGVPYLYYGDETGLMGGLDGEPRRPIVIDSTRWNTDCIRWYQLLMYGVRRTYPVFKYGNVLPQYIDDQKGVFGFWRRYRDDWALVIINTSGDLRSVDVRLQADAPDNWVNLLTDRHYHRYDDKLAIFSIPQHWGIVLVPEEPEEPQQ